MLLAEFSMSPLDKGTSFGVRRALPRRHRPERAALPPRPMGTCVEGEWDEVMAVVRACFERMSQDCERITISFKGDWRRGRSDRLEAKIQAVEQHLGRQLKK